MENIYLMWVFSYWRIFSFPLFHFFFSPGPSLFPYALGLSSSLQCHSGFSPDVASCGGEMITIWPLISFSLTVFPALILFFSVLLVTRLNLLLLFASPLSSYCDVLYMGGKCRQREIRLVLYMCRNALGIYAFLCSSCCVICERVSTKTTCAVSP